VDDHSETERSCVASPARPGLHGSTAAAIPPDIAAIDERSRRVGARPGDDPAVDVAFVRHDGADPTAQGGRRPGSTLPQGGPMTTSRTKQRMAALITAGALALSMSGVCPAYAAQATRPSRAPKVALATPHTSAGSSTAAVASASPRIPAIVDPVADLGRQKAGPEPNWLDSIRFTSLVTAKGHEFGVQGQTVALPNVNGGRYRWTLAVTDKTTGWHQDYEAVVSPDDYRWTEGRLDVKAPGLSWTGDSRRQRLQVTTPFGSLDIDLVATGPALLYGGAGTFRLVDVPRYEFAYPRMRTTGTLTIGEKKHNVQGTTWLDRQWGEMPENLTRWTWTSFHMPNGDNIALWDAVGKKSQHSWATVVHPDGSHEVVEAEPLARNATRPWTSPHTGRRYPTRWRIRIPRLNTSLTVRVTGPEDQEIRSSTPGGGYMRATAAFTGTYDGRKVSGETYVDMNGDWRP
jgi:hypothetical protein